jgi:hypothetical protein
MSLFPHPPQNFVPGGLSIPQAAHLLFGGAACIRFCPQLLQKRTVCAFFAPHVGHSFKSMLAPQLLQNLPVPAGLPQVGQIVVLLSIAPCQTVADCPALSILRFIACARACATYTSCLGAQSTHSPSSSFKQWSHAYLLQFGQR